MLNGLDLFSGIGGLTMALASWVRPVAYCENDRYAQAVLLQKMREGSLPQAPIWDDICTLLPEMLPGPVDIIYGGFPCQDVSQAGSRKGLEGKRTGLFFQAIRLIRECRPTFVFFENVPGIKKFIPSIRAELEKLDYLCRDGFLSAASIGAPHIRQRWWLLAYTDSIGIHAKQVTKQECKSSSLSSRHGKEKSMAYPKSLRSKGRSFSTKEGRQERSFFNGQSWWQTEPDVGRVADGVSFRVDRLRGLGNAVVPLQAQEAFKRLMGL